MSIDRFPLTPNESPRVSPMQHLCTPNATIPMNLTLSMTYAIDKRKTLREDRRFADLCGILIPHNAMSYLVCANARYRCKPMITCVNPYASHSLYKRQWRPCNLSG
jgi:hypothetical protein